MKLVAVTSCPTGIAHTFMAAEKIEAAAKKLGFEVKVEAQGVKIENELTDQDIKEADIVILAVDKEINMDRFSGKTVKIVSTARTIKESEIVIDEAINGVGTRRISGSMKNNKQTNNKNIYTHFMSGVNYMLPFVIAGGIIIAMSFAFGIEASNPNSDKYNIIAATLDKIGGGTAFALMVPALGAGIASSIAGRAGFAPGLVVGTLAASGGSGFLGGMVGGLLAGYVTNFFANEVNVPKSLSSIYQLIVVPLVSILIIGFAMIFLIDKPIGLLLETLTNFLNGLGETSGVMFGLLIGIMMASDMGGPINKAISTFSIGLMSAGVNGPIAACMAAGMTPPLGLALATVLFKNKFTEEEKVQGQSAWVLGASYITEGAIPFAVSDPVRVIPSLMVGSAVAAAISLGFGVTSMAPHGGIWVLLVPNVINKLGIYLLAILAGTIATAITVGILKKPIEN